MRFKVLNYKILSVKIKSTKFHFDNEVRNVLNFDPEFVELISIYSKNYKLPNKSVLLDIGVTKNSIDHELVEIFLAAYQLSSQYLLFIADNQCCPYIKDLFVQFRYEDMEENSIHTIIKEIHLDDGITTYFDLDTFKKVTDSISNDSDTAAITNESSNDYIGWDSYFMGIALMAKSRSKDPSTQVGACIVKNNRIISTGYNGFPAGCSDDEFPWGKGNESEYDNKYYYVVHAELNAILNCKVPMDNATLYVTMFPCNECIKAIIQAGIKKIIFYEADKKYLTPGSEKMLKAAKIETVKYNTINKEIKLEL